MLISFVRTIILYIFVIFGLRLMGKRQIGEMQPSELVVSIMISDLATIPMSDTSIPLIYGIIPILTLVVMEIFISAVLLKSYKLRQIVTGRPSVIVDNGEVIQKEMKKQRFNITDLTEQLRLKGYYDLSEVNTVVLETNGQLTIIPKSKNKVPVCDDLNVSTAQEKLPVILISEGKFMENNLKLSGISREKIYKILKKEKLKSEKDVYFMTFYEGDFHIQKMQ